MQYKTTYKQAYSDISQAFTQAIFDQSLTPRTADNDVTATASEWAVIKGAFKSSKDCAVGHIDECWVPGETMNGQPNLANDVPSFIDSSGRAWAIYFKSENVYFVDTNGAKKPNKFGKDRWVFVLAQKDDSRVSVGLPDRVGISMQGGAVTNSDVTTASEYCHYPPCYYYSWLYEQ